MITIFLLFSLSTQASETREKIALIDSGISVEQRFSKFACKEKPLNFTNDSFYTDKLNHGKILFNILSKYIDPKKHCILSLKIFTKRDDNDIENELKALKYADSKEFKFFNMSYVGDGYNSVEFELIKNLTQRGVVIAAAGNKNKNLTKTSCHFFPACYSLENLYVATSLDSGYGNFGEKVDFSIENEFTYMGSSMATPHALGRLIKQSYKDKK